MESTFFFLEKQNLPLFSMLDNERCIYLSVVILIVFLLITNTF